MAGDECEILGLGQMLWRERVVGGGGVVDTGWAGDYNEEVMSAVVD